MTNERKTQLEKETLELEEAFKIDPEGMIKKLTEFLKTNKEPIVFEDEDFESYLTPLW